MIITITSMMCDYLPNIYMFFPFFLEDHEARSCIHQRVEVPVRIKFCLWGYFNVSYKFLIVIIFKFIVLSRVGLQQVITCQNWTKFFRYILFYQTNYLGYSPHPFPLFFIDHVKPIFLLPFSILGFLSRIQNI